jgi:hypothetical protein
MSETMNNRFLTFLMVTLLGGSVFPAYAASEVFLLGTLYKRHEQVPAYDVATLTRIVETVAPEVLVLDVTPDELKKQAVFPGKVEYTKGIFPLLKKHKFIVYPAEPAEPLFTEIVDAAKASLARFDKEQPVLSASFKRTEKNVYTVLGSHWTSAARVQDNITGEMIDSVARLQGELVGSAIKDGDERWDRHTADVVIKAASEHPGKRILVLTGIRNRPLVQRYLQAAPDLRLVDMPAWLTKANF